jgi:hypothetical protein
LEGGNDPRNPFRVRSKSPDLEIMPEPPKPHQRVGSAQPNMENKGAKLKMQIPKGILKTNSDLTNVSYLDSN